MKMQYLHLQILYLPIQKGKGQSAKYAAKHLNGGLRMGTTEDQGTPVACPGFLLRAEIALGCQYLEVSVPNPGFFCQGQRRG